MQISFSDRMVGLVLVIAGMAALFYALVPLLKPLIIGFIGFQLIRYGMRMYGVSPMMAFWSASSGFRR